MIDENTQKVKQPVFHRSGRAWRDFRFSRLQKIDKPTMEAVQKLEWLMPGIYLGKDAMADIKERLSEVLGEPVKLRLEFTRAISPGDLRKYVADPAFLCVLGTGADRPRCILDIDLSLAHAIIDLLLGGAGESVAQKTLSDIEEGMMTYVVLEMLKGISAELAPGIPRLRLEGVCDSVSAAARHLVEDAHVMIVQIQCIIGRHAGGIRFLVPARALEDIQAPSESKSVRERRRALFSIGFERLQGISSHLRVEFAAARVGLADLKGVRPGDVVLLDEWSARPDEESSGTAKIRIGHGKRGYWEAEIFLEDDAWQAKLNRFERKMAWKSDGHPKSEGEEGESENMDADLSDDAMDSIEDIPLSLSVELARIPVSAEEVLALKAGQVIELKRSAGEMVDLSVNGKVIGRGELVEVEGQLGVRISHMASQ